MKKILIAGLTCLTFSLHVEAQRIDYATYIQTVLQRNPSAVAARMERDIAHAELQASKRHNDPSLSISYGNNSDWDIAMGQSAEIELSKSFGLGKRSSRIAVARHTLHAKESEANHYEHNLRADASLAWVDALLAREQLRLAESYALNMQQLFESDSLRCARGDLAEIEMLQTLLEAQQARGEALQAATDYHNALLLLDLLMGNPTQGTTEVEGDLTLPTLIPSLEELLRAAQTSRDDLQQKEHEVEASRSAVTLTRRERTPDIDLSLGMSYNSRVRNAEAPAPRFVGYSVGISLPLPISNFNRGDIEACRIRAQQSEIGLVALHNEVESEVRQAYNRYCDAIARATRTNSTVLQHARQVLDGRRYAYQRGENSLLEVLNAEHAFIDLQKQHLAALHESMTTWIELQRCAGIAILSIDSDQ